MRPANHSTLNAALVAGETSGDLLAGLLLDGLRSRWPELHSAGIGGQQMVQRGFQAWWGYDKLSVHGFGWDVIRRYPEIMGIRAQLKKRLLLERPDVFIGVDAPDFNLDLEAALKHSGIKTVHFVCPSVWAWRPERLEKIKRSVDVMLCIFPFEPAFLAQHGIAATYVGHPLANVVPMQPDRAAARLQLGLPANCPVVAIFPGSRLSEIKHIALRCFRAAALIHQAKSATKFIVSAVPFLQSHIMAAAVACNMQEKLLIVNGQSHPALAACDVALVASGTATLEAALFKRPMVITYAVSALSWQIMRRKQLQPWVGLPNILCQQFVVPEFLQDAATPPALANAVLTWLEDSVHQPAKIMQIEQRFAALHRELQQDTPHLATHAIENILSL